MHQKQIDKRNGIGCNIDYNPNYNKFLQHTDSYLLTFSEKRKTHIVQHSEWKRVDAYTHCVGSFLVKKNVLY